MTSHGTKAHTANLHANDGVALGTLSKETWSWHVGQGPAPEPDESAAGRGVRYTVSRQGRILLLGAEATIRCKRYGAFFVWHCQVLGWIHVEKMSGRASHS